MSTKLPVSNRSVLLPKLSQGLSIESLAAIEQHGPEDEDEDEGAAGTEWRVGDVVDVETEDGWERGAVVIGASLSGAT
jgi:hypothetical protein